MKRSSLSGGRTENENLGTSLAKKIGLSCVVVCPSGCVAAFDQRLSLSFVINSRVINRRGDHEWAPDLAQFQSNADFERREIHIMRFCGNRLLYLLWAEPVQLGLIMVALNL